MPIIDLHLRAGRTPEEKQALLATIQAAVVEICKVRGESCFKRIREYAPEDFLPAEGKSEKCLIIELSLIQGRALETKRTLYRELVDKMAAFGVPGDAVVVVLREEPGENWGIRGGHAACDIL